MSSIELIPDNSLGKILCCDCGIAIAPNPANCCIACVRAKNDISEGIPKQSTLCFCKACERYLDPPSTWVTATLESKELLRICLNKLKGLNQVRLTDAGFAWTEPHSKRLKVKLTIQKEIQEGAVLQQVFIVEYVISHQMCDDCHRIEAKDYWRAVVQVRQKTDHKRTFYYLEQLILKHKAHEKALGIKPVAGGLDFFFSNDQDARRMVDFLGSVVPCKWVDSKKLISHDIHSNTYNYKRTFCVDIVPVCKDSIVCLPRAIAHQLGGIGQVCIVNRVTSYISLISPRTAQVAEINSSTFYSKPFGTLCTSKKLTKFIVMQIDEADIKHFSGQGHISKRHQVKEVWVEKESELGEGKQYFCHTHLGHLLSYGDTVLGFDVKNANLNDSNFDMLKDSDIPDVVLVKKVYADKATRNRRRRWRLKHLDVQEEVNSQNSDYVDFLEDLEEDPNLRVGVNIFEDKRKVEKMMPIPEEDVGELPEISLEEMLNDLEIEDSKES